MFGRFRRTPRFPQYGPQIVRGESTLGVFHSEQRAFDFQSTAIELFGAVQMTFGGFYARQVVCRCRHLEVRRP
jgi:hypothetical protein